MRQIFGPVEVEVAAIGGIQLLGDDPPRPRLHRRPLRLRDGGGAGAGERLVEARLGRVLGDHAGNGPFVAAEHRAGQHVAAAHGVAGDRQRLVVEPRILRDAGQVAFEVGAGAEGQVAGHAGEALVPAVIGGEQHVALAEPVRLDRFRQRAAQDTMGDAVGGRELAGRNALEPGEEGLRLAHLALARFGREVLDAVVIVAHAERRRIGRRVAQQPAVMLVQQGAEIVGGRRGGGRRGGKHRGGEDGEAHRQVSPLAAP